MANSAADEIMNGLAVMYDELRPELFKKDNVLARCHLLSKVGETSEYEILLELTSGWYLSFEQYRAQSALRIARNDTLFVAAFNQMSDFAINGYVYSIDEPYRDKQVPQGDKFYYAAFATMNGDTIDIGSPSIEATNNWESITW